MKIEFYIPKDQIIPTQLRLKIDDKYHVYYKRVTEENGAWLFTFYNEATECWEELLELIIRTMVYQSEDHGSRWDVVDKTIDISELKFGVVNAKVVFRIRDAG